MSSTSDPNFSPIRSQDLPGGTSVVYTLLLAYIIYPLLSSNQCAEGCRQATNPKFSANLDKWLPHTSSKFQPIPFSGSQVIIICSWCIPTASNGKIFTDLQTFLEYSKRAIHLSNLVKVFIYISTKYIKNFSFLTFLVLSISIF